MKKYFDYIFNSEYISTQNLSPKFMNNNSNWRVVTLISICFLIYLILSILSFAFDFKWEPFEKVNLITDVFDKNKKSELAKANLQNTTSENPASNTKNLVQDFELYKKPQFITNFYKGDSVTALSNFAEKLYQLRTTKKGKIRIAYFGDSMIEGDLLTQTLRKLLQKEFGGYGVGFLPIHSKVGGFRQTATVKSSGWETINFMDKGAKNMYISGFSFSGLGNGSFTDRTVTAPPSLQKFLIYGQSNGGSIDYDGTSISLQGNNLVNSLLLSNNNATSFKLKSNSATTPFYGVSFESENGIILDNFSFRGITGVEFRKIDENFLKAVQSANHYDLIVMQYGVNLLFRPNDTDYSYYTKNMTPVLEKFISAFPNTDILLVSSADRAFRYNGEYQTAKGLPNLLETQARLAYDHHLAFFNLFETMGGENSIVDWASQKPPLANKDYVHPNGKGADILAEKLFHAMMNDYNNYKPKTETAP